MRPKHFLAAFATAVVANLVGVFLFFRPISEGDTARLSVHPAVGLLVYVGLCAALFDWGARQLRSPYKSAFFVAAAQFVLIVDLTLRGERGWITTLAGGVLLAVTWAAVAFVVARFEDSRDDASS